MTDEEAQDILDDGHCPECGKPLAFGEEPDEYGDGHVGVHVFAECIGLEHHRYSVEGHRWDDCRPIWEATA